MSERLKIDQDDDDNNSDNNPNEIIDSYKQASTGGRERILEL